MKIAFALCLVLLCGSALAQSSIDIPLPTNLGDNITIPISSSLTCSTTQTVKILNYALQLEYMQAEYWRQARAIFEGLGNQTVGTVSAACRNQSNVFSRMQDIESQDNAHASQLNATVSRLCSDLPDGDDKNECFAVKPCAFNFSFPQNASTTDDYNGILGKGVQLEDTVVYAYIGMIPQLLDTQASQLLTRIATVDARHASWARQLSGQQPFPGALDSPQSRNQVKCSLRQYIQKPDCCAGWQRLQC